MTDDRSLLDAALDDGRFLIALTGISLILSGVFAVLQSVSGQLLPHDSHAIGMESTSLVRAGNRHLLGFMFHDRVAYGGSILAIGTGYLWLAAFPMKGRAAWVWWALVLSGGTGFLAFLTYLGHGYLDTWHGVATLFLLPVFVTGVWRYRPNHLALRSVWIQDFKNCGSFCKWGRILLGGCSLGLILAGLTIALFGMTTVFVPSDLRFIGLSIESLHKISPMLIPVISHDRAEFGGALCSIGCLLLFMARCAELNRSLIEIIAVMGCTGFASAIGVHFAVGYVDLFHLLPAFVGFSVFILADAFLWVAWRREARVGLTAKTKPSGHVF
jgi:hypothetical protein